MSLIISLKWMMRIITNQVHVFGCECCLGAAKWTGRRPLKAHMETTEKAEWRIWAKYPEKYSSKWGVPGPTVQLIKMSTPSQWSAVSPVLHIFLVACRCDLQPLSTRADTCLNNTGKWGQMCRCVLWWVCVRVCHFWESSFKFDILWKQIFLWITVILWRCCIFQRVLGKGVNTRTFSLLN